MKISESFPKSKESSEKSNFEVHQISEQLFKKIKNGLMIRFVITEGYKIYLGSGFHRDIFREYGLTHQEVLIQNGSFCYNTLNSCVYFFWNIPNGR
ncbi:hypothetical protein IT399_02715 [Candidatus Nomurabacteria bacterium]|nr:hypothetical protein [Candidatus Nomurabacteria bacterium]